MTEYAILLTGDWAHGEAGEDRWANVTAEERATTFARHDGAIEVRVCVPAPAGVA